MTLVTILPAIHTSEATAYLVSDYPYGFTMRCQIRFWIETSKNGQRFCSQTTNPKRPGTVWNKPKKDTYSSLCMMGLDDKGHVQSQGIRIEYTEPKEIDAFLERYPETTDPTAKELISKARMVSLSRKKMHEKTGGKNIYDFPASERQRIVTESITEANQELGI